MKWMPKQSIDLDAAIPAQRETTVAETMLVIWRQRRLIAGLVVLALCGTAIALLGMDKSYVAEALVQVDFGRDQPAPAAGPSSTGIQIDPNALVEGEARLIRSQVVARRVIQRLDLETDPAFAPRAGYLSGLLPAWLQGAAADPATRADLIALKLLNQLSVKNDTRSYLISVSFVSADPERSAAVANAFAEEYLRTRVEAGVEVAQRTGVWLAAQIRDVRDALASAEESVLSYRRSSGFVEASAEGSGVSQNQLRDVTTQLEAATLARIVAEGRLKKAREAVEAGYAPEPADPGDAGVLQRLAEAEAVANRTVAETRLAYGARHPNAERAVAAQLAAKEQLATEMRRILAAHGTGLASAQATEASLQGRVDLLQRAAIDAKGRESRLRSLQAEASALRERFRILTDGHDRARALTELRPAAAKIVLPAKPTTVPSGPNRPLMLAMATAAATGAGILAALLLNRRDRGFDSDRQIALTTGRRCLAAIPEVRQTESPLQWALFSESVRNLAANLGLYDSTTSRVVLITSAAPQEGKTILAVALAKCLAEIGQQVLVIDTSPGTVGDQKTDPAATLEELLDGSRGLAEGEDAGSRVRLLRRSTGLGDDPPIFGAALDRLIQTSRQHYDTVLIEAAPIELLADAVILARSTDVTVLTARWMSTPRARVEEAIERLETSHNKVAGVVLSRIDPDALQGKQSRRARSIYFNRHVSPDHKLALGSSTCAS